MTERKSVHSTRFLPGVVIVALSWAITFIPGLVAPATFAQGIGMMAGPTLGLLALLIWWLWKSRAPRTDRFLGLLAPIAFIVLTGVFLHRSAPLVFLVYGLPVLSLAFLVCAFFTRRWPDGRRRLALVATIALATGFWTLIRSEGVDGDMGSQISWRWQQTSEERLLAAGAIGKEVPGSVSAADLEVGIASWPGFRGASRDGVVRGQRLSTDWASTPPQELWRRAVGPGWGSFALAGDLLYTQEQHGDEEVVAAYDRRTGEPVWQHRDEGRFWEAMAGAGPRATPSLRKGRLFTVGALGALNSLDAATGRKLWSRDLAQDSGAPVPEWGFSSSPLLMDDLVIVVTGAPVEEEDLPLGAPERIGVVAYDFETGEPRWFGATGPLTYSSAHLTTLDGVRQILVLTDQGATALDPKDGTTLWEHTWVLPGGARIVQPALTQDGDVLIGTGFGLGLRRISVERQGDDWQIEERWTSKGLKPYYNDIVLHDGYAYGFDGRILSCVRLEDGERMWKGGRYGSGQALLLPEQDLLLVLSDRGDVALVRADPGGFEEVARIEAINGKTWNHPVLVDRVLYVRNGEEMAAFRLPTESPTSVADLPR